MTQNTMSQLPPNIEPGLVSAIICNYNGARHLDDCLSSLKAQSYPRLEIVVSDNGSTDGSEQICAKYGVRFAPSGANNGLAWAYNAGVRRSRGEYAFVANNDMWFAPDCVERLVESMRVQGESCFAADPLQYTWGGTQIIHYRTVLRPPRGPRELITGAFSIFPLLAQGQIPTEVNAVSFMASAGAMLVRRTMFDQLGGFDETFFMDWEDVDICWRANRRGWTSLFVPSARLRHKWGATNGDCSGRTAGKPSPMARRCALSQQYNMLRFALKNWDWPNAIAYVGLRCAANLAYVFRGRAFYSVAGLKAMAKVIRTLPEILSQRHAICRTATVSNRELFRRFRVSDRPGQTSWSFPGLEARAERLELTST
jgi:GT2 family glycosyltransferase